MQNFKVNVILIESRLPIQIQRTTQNTKLNVLIRLACSMKREIYRKSVIEVAIYC